MTQTSKPADAVSTWLASFETALLSGDVHRIANLFTEDCYWRDFVSYTKVMELNYWGSSVVTKAS